MFYLFNAHKLAEKFKLNQISFLQIMPYGFLWIVSIGLNATIITSTPKLYTVIFSIIKEYLEEAGKKGQLSITVYHFTDEIFYWAVGFIIVIGIVKCCIINLCGDRKDFLKRLLCLSFPINMRLSLLTSILYLIPLLGAGIFFANKLSGLTKQYSSQALGYNPITIALKLTNKLNVFKYIMSQLQTLQEATVIYTQIDDMSALFYILALGLALFGLLRFFYLLCKEFAYISQK